MSKVDPVQRREDENTDLDSQSSGDKLVCPNVLVFVESKLSLRYARNIDREGRGGTMLWCGQWWRHEEAFSRLTALWRAWESLRKDPTTGIAVWWRDYADPTMRALFDPLGPFEGCTPDKHDPQVYPLVTVKPPEGMFD